jgi:methionyl-tRNA formyltransferase
MLDVVLFALTGFGNPVLLSLLEDNRVNVLSVFTAKYDNPFPYYQERQLIELCTLKNIPCYYRVKVGSKEGSEQAPHLIIVATFKQILPQSVISLPPMGIVNLHPSLLPSYRGPSPTNAVLLNGEDKTGITVHYIAEELDAGNILLQRTIPIEETDNDGILRRKLAALAGQMIPNIVSLFDGFNKPVGIPQNHELASYAPRPKVEDGYLERETDINSIARKVRALNPLPGTSILIGNERIIVHDFELIEGHQDHGVKVNPNSVDMLFKSEGIRLYRKT